MGAKSMRKTQICFVGEFCCMKYLAQIFFEFSPGSLKFDDPV